MSAAIPGEVSDALAQTHPTLSGAALDELAYGIDRECAAQVLYEFTDGREGHRAGSFRLSLFVTMSKADPENMARLTIAFPAEALAFSVGQYVPNGLAALRKAANRG
ncbi:hypothetical protein SEA_DOGFISH_39 [Gordonia phage Dogfish]|nr:hypothetical protein SEA_DOGFISH_39 [Gordonia phage Dogfish]